MLALLTYFLIPAASSLVRFETNLLSAAILILNARNCFSTSDRISLNSNLSILSLKSELSFIKAVCHDCSYTLQTYLIKFISN